MSLSPVYLGIDVGTGSARAGVFDATGRLLAAAPRPIQMWRPHPDHVEQSSDDIWRAVCAAVREALQRADVPAQNVRGLGFDATCSLVVLDADDRPVAVNDHGRDEQNVIVWMDHRAVEQAERINRTGHGVLQYVGGVISPEMQSPKLLWLKENLLAAWRRARRFFDLPDFLTYRATGDETRSLCTTVCKWTYLGHEKSTSPHSVGRWDDTFFRQAGLGDLVDDGYRRIGTRVRPMGEAVGRGLTEQAATELGLPAGTPVGVAIIDAHAGGLGVLGVPLAGRPTTTADLNQRIALIGGTSSCHMAVSPEPRFFGGVWGPYYSAMVPGLWLTEGGQSATGALIDHVIDSSAVSQSISARIAGRECTERTVHAVLNARLDRLAEKLAFPALLTRELHVLPYFHGNRSPRADPSLRGAVSGLKLASGEDELAALYLATIQAIAHGTRHILETLNAGGYAIDTVLACGGGTKNPVFLREHADVTGCRIVLPREPEAVLLGAAMLGAVASGDQPAVLAAMAALAAAGQVIEPAGGDVKRYHDAKHRVFHRMYEDQLAYRDLMKTGRG